MFGLEASFYSTIYKEQKYGREKTKYKTAEVYIINKETGWISNDLTLAILCIMVRHKDKLLLWTQTFVNNEEFTEQLSNEKVASKNYTIHRWINWCFTNLVIFFGLFHDTT